MSLKKFKLITLILSFGLFVLVLSGCANTKATATDKNSEKLNIVTTTDFYGEVAKAVVGDKGTVSSIINNPAIDPHDYEPTTKTAKLVSKADITVANGLGYDSWMDKLNNDSNNTYIKIGENVMHKKIGANPHVWYNPETMPKYANYLAAKLAKKQPKNKA